MSGREWKPGDLVALSAEGKRRADPWFRDAIGVVVAHPRSQRQWLTWIGRDVPSAAHGATMTTKWVRPLVAINPDEALGAAGLPNAEISNVLRSIRDHKLAHPEGQSTWWLLIDWLAEAFEVTPPRPKEPTGRYAVVYDENAVEWVRADVAGVSQWCALAVLDDNGQPMWRDWDEIPVERVLSEGVQP